MNVGRDDMCAGQVGDEPAFLPKRQALFRMRGGPCQITPMQRLGGYDIVKQAQGQRIHRIQGGGHPVEKPVRGFEIEKIMGRPRAVGLKKPIQDVDPHFFREGKSLGRNLKAPLVQGHQIQTHRLQSHPPITASAAWHPVA